MAELSRLRGLRLHCRPVSCSPRGPLRALVIHAHPSPESYATALFREVGATLERSGHAVQTCDLLICVGARFDDRATGRLNAFAPNAKVIHLDVDRAEIGKLRRADVPVIGNLRHALKVLSCRLANIEPWRRECAESKETHAWDYAAPGTEVYAPGFLKSLSDRLSSIVNRYEM